MIISNLRRKLYDVALKEASFNSEKEVRAFLRSDFSWFLPISQFKPIAKKILKRLPRKLSLSEKTNVVKIMVYCCSKVEQETYLKHFKINLNKMGSEMIFEWIMDQFIYLKLDNKICESIWSGFRQKHLEKNLRLSADLRFVKKNYFFDQLIKKGLDLPFVCDLNSIVYLSHKYFKKIFIKNENLFNKLLNTVYPLEYDYLSPENKKNADLNIKLISRGYKKELKEVFFHYPVIESILSNFNGANLVIFKSIATQTHVHVPKITDYLKNCSGVKSSNVVKLFLKSNQKHTFISFARIGKLLFVDHEKVDYSLNILSQNMFFVNRKYRHSLFAIAQNYAACFDKFFTPEQNFSLFNQLITDSNNQTIPIHVARKLMKLVASEEKIDIKFSDINTWSKLDNYCSLKVDKIENQEVNLMQELKCPPLFKLHNLKLKESELLFKVPQTNYELFDWGFMMHNCVGDYAETCIKDNSYIIGVFKENKILYCLEIDRCGKVAQIEAKYKGAVAKKDLEEIELSIKKIFQ